uniref:Envelope-like protein n=1 Tax=Panagrellus redivivus TaxID=6233 RepID=A0A7E4W1P0_PANRE
MPSNFRADLEMCRKAVKEILDARETKTNEEKIDEAMVAVGDETGLKRDIDSNEESSEEEEDDDDNEDGKDGEFFVTIYEKEGSLHRSMRKL